MRVPGASFRVVGALQDDADADKHGKRADRAGLAIHVDGERVDLPVGVVDRPIQVAAGVCDSA